MTSPLVLPAAPLLEQYGEEARLCSCANDQLTLVFSRRHPFDLVELEQLLELDFIADLWRDIEKRFPRATRDEQLRGTAASRRGRRR